jgi:four helix bundle protein
MGGVMRKYRELKVWQRAMAEGAGNDSNKEFCHFLQIALRSTYAVMTAIEIARGLEFF